MTRRCRWNRLQKADAILSGARSYQRGQRRGVPIRTVPTHFPRRGPDCSDTAWWADYGFRFGFCFTVSFLFLRERTGGYHAKTEWQCALYSAAMIFATMFALPIFAEEPNNYWAIMIASSALIWVSSPADNKQIHLSRAESKAMAKRARLRLLLLDAVSLALLGVHGHLFASSIALAELSVAVSLMMATAGFGIQ